MQIVSEYMLVLALYLVTIVIICFNNVWRGMFPSAASMPLDGGML